jgi:hypothetical protein
VKDHINSLYKSGIKTLSEQATSMAFDRSCAGRLLNALRFLIVILCLSVWITAFLTVKDRFLTEKFTGNVLTNLTCITFFGGLATAFLIGTLAGNFLRRSFWKYLVKRKKIYIQ